MDACGFKLRQAGKDGFVDRAGTQRAAYDKERFSIIDYRFSTLQKILPYRIAGEDDLIGREETLHTFVGYADLGGFILEDLIGHAGKTVLLLEQDRDAHVSGRPHGCAGRISADADSDVGLEIADDLLHLVNGLGEVDEYRHVLPGLGTVEPAHRQTDDLVPCLRYTLHLHAPQRTDKQYLRLRIQFLQRVCNRYSGKYMTACTSS